MPLRRYIIEELRLVNESDKWIPLVRLVNSENAKAELDRLYKKYPWKIMRIRYIFGGIIG